jgi:hypothetical protein
MDVNATFASHDARINDITTGVEVNASLFSDYNGYSVTDLKHRAIAIT